MGALIDKLNATNAYKEQIRQAIERKRVSISKSTKLRDYPAKIDAIYPDALFLKDSKICKSNSFSVFENVIYANGIYISSGDIKRVASDKSFYVGSENAGWVKKSFSMKDDHRPNIIYGNGMFITAHISSDNNKQVVAQLSTDGVNWTQYNVYELSGSVYIKFVTNAVFNGKEFALTFRDSANYYYFLTSTDGKTWTKVGQSPLSIGNLPALVFCEQSGTYLLARYKSVYKSSDFKNWYEAFPNVDADSIDEIVKVINGVAFVTCQSTSGYEDDVFYFDKSGSWQKLNSPYGYKILGGTYKNGQYILIFQAFSSELTSSRYSYFTVFVNNLSDIYTATKYWFGIGGDMLGQPHIRVADCVSFANNTFFMSCNGGDVSLFSHDGVSWFDNIDKVVIDTSDNDVTYETLIKMNGISAAVLQAAYNAGVNSI